MFRGMITLFYSFNLISLIIPEQYFTFVAPLGRFYCSDTRCFINAYITSILLLLLVLNTLRKSGKLLLCGTIVMIYVVKCIVGTNNIETGFKSRLITPKCEIIENDKRLHVAEF